jgi:hypothetical protein
MDSIRLGGPHVTFRVNAQAIQNPVDEVKLTDALNGINKLLVGVAMPAQCDDVMTAHVGRSFCELHGIVEQLPMSEQVGTWVCVEPYTVGACL